MHFLQHRVIALVTRRDIITIATLLLVVHLYIPVVVLMPTTSSHLKNAEDDAIGTLSTKSLTEVRKN